VPVREIAEAVGVNKTTAAMDIRRLRRAGRIGYRYRVKNFASDFAWNGRHGPETERN
jgi:DNA-binding Lrp family transcriptional regulator